MSHDDLVTDLPSTLPRYYAHYMDDGPAGPGGQSLSSTAPWNKLYVFDSPKVWLDFIHDVSVETFRSNARVVGAWSHGDDHYEQITDWTGNKPGPDPSLNPRKAA